MEIVKLSKEMNEKKIVFEYMTSGHYKVTENNHKDNYNLSLTYEEFAQPISKSFTDVLVGDYLENPQSFGVYIDQDIVGYLVVNFEEYNNRMRITQLLVDQRFRRQGIGKSLMSYAEKLATSVNARALVLETQTCNIPAITFYKKCGYKIIGIDLISYSNTDVDNQEVRLEMAKLL